MPATNAKAATRMRNVHRVRRRLSDGEYRTHYYHRYTRMKLPGRPGSPEFMAAYQAAEQGWANRASMAASNFVRSGSIVPSQTPRATAGAGDDKQT